MEVEYTYDFRNRWVRKILNPGVSEEKTIFVYDGNQIILQFDKTGSGLVATSDLSHRYLWGTGVDQILADEQVTDLQTAGTVLWPLCDHLGSVRDVAQYDSQSQTTSIVKHRVYDAYGNITADTAPGVYFLLAFTARPFDADTALQNNLHRWYDLSTGRWMSEDPLLYKAGDTNLYRYCGNSPTNYTDPLGLLKIKIGGYVFYVHKNDPDPFPSQPHGHVGGPTSPLKVNVETGELFQGTTATGRNIGRKTLAALRQRLRGAGLLCLAAVIVLETPDMVQAAQQGGVSGVVSHTGDLAVQTAVATGETVAIGGAVMGGASLAGTSVTTTAGGATLVGVGGAATVGGVVVVGAGVGGAIGYGIGSIPIGGHTIHEHLGEGMYWAGHGIYVGASSAWNWITDW